MSNMTNKKIHAALFIFSIIVLFMLIISKIPHRQNVVLKDSSADNKIYSLKPVISNYDIHGYNLAEDYPKTTVKYNDSILFLNRYFLSYAIEEINLKNSAYNYLYYATLRIEELKEWGTELPIIGITPDEKSLQNWWLHSKPHIYRFDKSTDLANWEASLARYEDLINGEIRTIPLHLDQDQNLFYYILKGHLDNHEADLSNVILNSQYSDSDKKYLNELVHSVFETLRKNISLKVPEYDPARLQYSLVPIINDEGYGEYHLSFDITNQPDFLKKNETINIGSRTFDQSQSKNRGDSANFDTISIRPGNTTLILKFPDAHLTVDNSSWREGQSANQYVYTTPFPKLANAFYLLKIRYRFKNNVVMNIIQSDMQNGQSQSLFTTPLILDGYDHILEIPVRYQNLPGNQYFISFTSQDQVPTEDIFHTVINYQPIVDPNIVLEKNVNAVNNGTANNNIPGQDSPVRRAIQNMLFVILLLSLCLNGFMWLYQRFNSKINLFLRTIEKIIIKTRIIWLVLMTAWIVIDSIATKQNAEWFYDVLIILMFLTFTGFRATSRFTFLSSFGMLIAGTVSYLLNSEVFTEKLSVYAFLLLILAAIKLMIEYLSENLTKFR